MFVHKRTLCVGLKERRFVPVHTMKAYRGSKGTSPLILNLGTRLKRMVSAKPLPYYSLEIILVSIQQEAVWGPRAGVDVSERTVYCRLGCG